MMNRSTAYQLRNLIHLADCAARSARSQAIQTNQREALPVIDREIDLAVNASMLIWEVREAPEGYTDPKIKLWSSVVRAARINFARWAPVLIALEKIFRGSSFLPLTANAQ